MISGKTGRKAETAYAAKRKSDPGRVAGITLRCLKTGTTNDIRTHVISHHPKLAHGNGVIRTTYANAVIAYLIATEAQAGVALSHHTGVQVVANNACRYLSRALGLHHHTNKAIFQGGIADNGIASQLHNCTRGVIANLNVAHRIAASIDISQIEQSAGRSNYACIIVPDYGVRYRNRPITQGYNAAAIAMNIGSNDIHQ